MHREHHSQPNAKRTTSASRLDFAPMAKKPTTAREPARSRERKMPHPQIRIRTWPTHAPTTASPYNDSSVAYHRRPRSHSNTEANLPNLAQPLPPSTTTSPQSPQALQNRCTSPGETSDTRTALRHPLLTTTFSNPASTGFQNGSMWAQ